MVGFHALKGVEEVNGLFAFRRSEPTTTLSIYELIPTVFTTLSPS